LGYWLIEDWSISEALFMTVITVTTIGYGEVRPLSPEGRLFTIALILIGVATFTYTLSQTAELFLAEDVLIRIRDRRRRNVLKKLNNHTIICGFGRLGSSLTKELQTRNSALVVIDSDDKAIETCTTNGIPCLQGSATDEQILREAGIDRASALVTVTPSDAENVFIVLTARSINPKLQIISRCDSASSIPKLEKAGADKVISPHAITGRRIAHMLTHPNIIQFLDGILEFGDQRMRLGEFVIGENSPVANLTLREAKLGVAVLAVDHPDQPASRHPTAETKLMPGTAIIAMGLDQDLNRIEKIVQGRPG
jgi:voltage-gated potassium channel